MLLKVLLKVLLRATSSQGVGQGVVRVLLGEMVKVLLGARCRGGPRFVMEAVCWGVRVLLLWVIERLLVRVLFGVLKVVRSLLASLQRRSQCGSGAVWGEVVF